MNDDSESTNQGDRVDGGASDAAFAGLYQELRLIANQFFANGGPSATLNPTSVVHEAYIKLASAGPWNDRAHFHAVAARAMRQVLIDHARTRGRQKRGGHAQRMSLDTSVIGGVIAPVDFLEIDEVLSQLEAEEPRAARIVEMRFFGDLSMEQIAEQLGISSRTVERDWRFARAWLQQALSDIEPAL